MNGWMDGTCPCCPLGGGKPVGSLQRVALGWDGMRGSDWIARQGISRRAHMSRRDETKAIFSF